ncbi:MAG: TRAP transporter small permease subunit [Rhodobacteraceae bacterium]|nr:TRAP transporter small permease subunit [Paracoccaceae bacterium]
MRLFLQWFRRLNRTLELITAVTSATIAGAMVLALTLSALTRFFSGTGYDWFIELPPSLVPWMVFPLLGPLLRSGSHIQVDFLPNVISGRPQLVLRFVIHSTMLAGAVIFMLAGQEAVALFQRLGQLMELEIEIPIWWMYLAFPVGFGILALFCLELMLESLQQMVTGKPEAAS